MSTVLPRWRAAYRLRVSPGRAGLLLLAGAPLLLLLPLGRVPIFDGWIGAGTTLGLLYAFALAPVLGTDAGQAEPALLWIYQKGASVTDHVTARLCLDAALGLGLVCWWALVWLLVDLAIAHEPVLQIAVTTLAMALAFLIGLAFLFAAGATGTRRGTDLLAGLALIAMLQPLILPALPLPVRTAVHWLLPPIPDAITFATDLARGRWSPAAAAFAQVSAYVLACTAIGALFLERWRPRT